MIEVRITAKPELFSRTRILKGFSQRELARRCHLSHAYISLLERSVRSVSPAAAKKLSEVLELPMDELFIIG